MRSKGKRRPGRPVETDVSLRQIAVLAVVAGLRTRLKRSPTNREVAKALGIGQPSVSGHIGKLTSAGLLAKKKYIPKSLCLTDKASSVLFVNAVRQAMDGVPVPAFDAIQAAFDAWRAQA